MAATSRRGRMRLVRNKQTITMTALQAITLVMLLFTPSSQRPQSEGVTNIMSGGSMLLAQGFVMPMTSPSSRLQRQPNRPNNSILKPPPSTSKTSLHMLLPVPEGFFTITFLTSGLLLQFSKLYARVRLEENAWEQRLQEARERRLQDTTASGSAMVTELDLRRAEAAQEYSAYGVPAQQEREYQRRAKEGRTQVMDRETTDTRSNNDRMSDDDIQAFETEYNIDYDPYYDEPYKEEDLPTDSNYNVDSQYGDRIYDNGEIFFRDKDTGLFYRQGAKPRNWTFFK